MIRLFVCLFVYFLLGVSRFNLMNCNCEFEIATKERAKEAAAVCRVGLGLLTNCCECRPFGFTLLLTSPSVDESRVWDCSCSEVSNKIKCFGV